MRNRTTSGVCKVIAAALFVCLLQGCGGSMGIDGDSDGQMSSMRSTVAPVQPLLDDDGFVMPAEPRALPTDTGARTRKGRYASRAQADRESGADVIRLTVDCCTAEAADLAVLTAYGLQAAHDLPSTVLVLVDGANLRVAAAVVNRLDDGGLNRVFLVTH